MNNSKDWVQILNDGAEDVTDVDKLLLSARQTFRLVEPWFKASSPHPIVKCILANIREQACVYFDAIEISINTANIGYTFAEDAISLCQFAAEGVPAEEIIKFAKDMQKIAADANNSAREAAQKFRSVRTGIFAVTSLVLRSTEQVRDDGVLAKNSKEKHNKIVRCAAIVSGIAGIMTPIVSLIPPAAIALPVFFSLSCLAEITKASFGHRAKVREQQQMTCEKAVIHLEEIYNDLGGLVDSVGNFADWWMHMDTLLASIVSSSSAFNTETLDRARVITVHKRWTEVKQKYLLYKLGINHLQDFFPSSTARDVSRGLVMEKHGQYAAFVSAAKSGNTSQVDLVHTLISLARCVEGCRIVFNELKPDHLAPSGAAVTDTPLKLKQLRTLLKGVWEDLMLYLREFNTFGDEIVLSLVNSGIHTKAQMVSRADKDWTAVTRLATQAAAVKGSHDNVYHLLQGHTDPALKFNSDASRLGPNVRSNDVVSRRPLEDRNGRLRSQTVAETLQAHLEDDTSSLKMAEKALVEATWYFDELVLFWHHKSNIYGLFDDKSGTGADAKHALYIWEVYKTAVGTSLLSISHSCDSLVTEILEVPQPGARGGKGRFHMRRYFTSTGA